MKDKNTLGHDLHKELPKTKAIDDYWGQVSRTVNGKPVSQEQIDMIVDVINKNLIFNKTDYLLDLGCGNGALSEYFFNSVSAFQGVDFSNFLINVAKNIFENSPKYTFLENDILSFLAAEANPEKYTKALCYGAFPYLPEADAFESLKILNSKFCNISLVFIGNLPDRNKADSFYYENIDYEQYLNDPMAAIGIWRTKKEMQLLAKRAGWEVKFTLMPKDFYGAHFRYDALLYRK